MPRKRRFFIPDIPAHIVQRGCSREPVFFDQEDYAAYLTWLEEASARYGCAVHAYVLMTNHVHILATPTDEDGLSKMMQYLGLRYVPYINHRYGLSGSIWEGRFKASLIDSDTYLLACMRYIEMNPVRANMVEQAGQYKWSSYRKNALGQGGAWLEAHDLYRALARTKDKRLVNYQALFESGFGRDALNDIDKAWQTGTPLGGDHFKAMIEKVLQRKVGQNRRGRPVITHIENKSSDS